MCVYEWNVLLQVRECVCVCVCVIQSAAGVCVCVCVVCVCVCVCVCVVCVCVKQSAAGVFVCVNPSSISVPPRLMSRSWRWSVRLIDYLAAGLSALIASDGMTPDSSLWPPTGSSTLHCSHAQWVPRVSHTHRAQQSQTVLRHSKLQGSGTAVWGVKGKGCGLVWSRTVPLCVWKGVSIWATVALCWP